MNTEIKNLPFRMGDVVKYIGEDRTRQSGDEMIIHYGEINQGQIQYSTSAGSWYNHGDFELVREADEASLVELARLMAAEDSDEFDDEGTRSDVTDADVLEALFSSDDEDFDDGDFDDDEDDEDFEEDEDDEDEDA